MARLKRVTNKIFGETASTTGDSTNGPYIGQFGSAKKGTYFATSDVATIQNLDNGTEWANGWIDGVIPSNQYPTLPEMTGVNKVLSYQTGYLFQEGIPEWDANTEYHTNSIVKYASSTSSTSVTADKGTSTGITAVSVTKATFLTQLSADGQYKFIYNGSTWTYNGVGISLSTYGLSVTGTANENDEIIVTVETTVTVTGTAKIYVSIANNNTGNLPTNTTYWSENTLNLANTNLSNLTTTGNNKILPAQSTATATKYLMSNGTSAEWTTFTGANTNLSNLTANGEAHFSNPDLSNLSNDGNARLHALKSYSDNGELLTDAEGLADVKDYAHSTFDADKFTIVGSPIITNDGIASGFDFGSYLKTTNNIQTSSNMEIYAKFNSGSSFTTNPTITSLETIQCFGIRINNVQSKMQYYVSSSGSAWTTSGVYGDTTIAYNTDYWFKFVAKPNDIKCYISTDGLNWTLDTTITDTVYTTNAYKVLIGTGRDYGNYFNSGSIDLKQFSIKVDGVPVFSGNKTGIDTIKPNNYTDIGSPTISNTGILTGANTTAVSFTNVALANATTFDIYGNFICNDTSVDNQYIFTPTSGYGFSLYILGRNLCTNISSNGSSFNIALYGIVKALTQGVNYDYHINYDGTTYNFYIKEGYGSWILAKQYTGGISPALTSSIIYAIGGLSTSNRNINGTIDLNKSKVYINGDLVYQPCLLIPYTESKTGSKVVDSYYRNRVTDMYEQFGYAPYYTLSNTDFTLPMGEVYGLMGKIEENLTNKIDAHDKAHIVDTFTSGSTWGRIYSDGFKMQGGVVYGSATTETIPSPTLTENGVAGGNSIAVISDSERSASYKTYYAIDGNNTSQWIPDTNTWANHWWGIYFPNPVTFAKIEWLRRSGDTNNFLITGKIEYSSDGSNWTSLENISPTGQSGGNNNYQTVIISNTGTYAKYWRIYCLTGNGYCGFREISFYRDSSTKGLTQQVQGVNAIVFPEPFSSSSYSYSLEGLGGTATASTVSATGINLGTITATQVSWMASGY